MKLRDTILKGESKPSPRRLYSLTRKQSRDAEALWGSKVSPATVSALNKKTYIHIKDWRNWPLRGGRYPYVYVDGIYLR